MDDIVGMETWNTFEKLSGNSNKLLFLNVIDLAILFKVHTLNKLKDKKIFGLMGENLKKFHNIGMIELTEDLHL